jgi:hypothetical protein
MRPSSDHPAQRCTAMPSNAQSATNAFHSASDRPAGELMTRQHEGMNGLAESIQSLFVFFRSLKLSRFGQLVIDELVPLVRSFHVGLPRCLRRVRATGVFQLSARAVNILTPVLNAAASLVRGAVAAGEQISGFSAVSAVSAALLTSGFYGATTRSEIPRRT